MSSATHGGQPAAHEDRRTDDMLAHPFTSSSLLLFSFILKSGLTVPTALHCVARCMCCALFCEQMLAIMGPSGAGKTCLLNCLSLRSKSYRQAIELSNHACQKMVGLHALKRVDSLVNLLLRARFFLPLYIVGLRPSTRIHQRLLAAVFVEWFHASQEICHTGSAWQHDFHNIFDRSPQ